MEKVKIRLNIIETAFNFEQLRGKHESLITSDSEEKIKWRREKTFSFSQKKMRVLEKSTLNVNCGRTVGTISKQLNKSNVKFISEKGKNKIK